MSFGANQPNSNVQLCWAQSITFSNRLHQWDPPKVEAPTSQKLSGWTSLSSLGIPTIGLLQQWLQATATRPNPSVCSGPTAWPPSTAVPARGEYLETTQAARGRDLLHEWLERSRALRATIRPSLALVKADVIARELGP